MSERLLRTSGHSTFTRSAAPARVYNQQSRLQHSAGGAAIAHLWFSIAGIPTSAVITSATLTLRQSDNWPGGMRTLTVRAVGAYSGRTLKHSNRPAAFGPAATVTRGIALPNGTPWIFDVTDLVVASRQPGRGQGYFTVVSDDSTIRYLRGFRAPSGRPQLVVEYDLDTQPPSDVAPDGGAVSVRSPEITWTAASTQTHSRVQVSPEPTFEAIAYDSTLVANTERRWQLASRYQLPDDGAGGAGPEMYTRVLLSGPGGVSDWSPTAAVFYAPLPVVEITAPPAQVTDSSPTIAWTTPAQSAWQALTTQDGKVVWNSGDVPGDTDRAVTTERAIPRPGVEATAEVRVYDDVLRVAAAGAPIYGSDRVTFIFRPSAAIEQLRDVDVSDDTHRPVTELRWRTGPSGEVPDEVGIVRDGMLVARVASEDLSVGTDGYWRTKIFTAQPYRRAGYSVVAIRNRVIGTAGVVVDSHPVVKGMWLCDPATGRDVLLADRFQPSLEPKSTVSTSAALDTDHDYVREGAPRQPNHPIEGTLAPIFGQDVEDLRELLEEWRQEPRPLRLAYGAVNVPVWVHSLTMTSVRSGISEDTQRWQVRGVAVEQGREQWPSL